MKLAIQDDRVRPRQVATSFLKRAATSKTLRQLVILCVVWAILMLCVGYFASNEFKLGRPNITPGVSAPTLLRPFVQFDTRWYIDIATKGYHPDPSINSSAYPEAAKPAFFPLYPLLIRFVSLSGLNPITAGFILNVLFSLGAFLFLYALARDYLRKSSPALRAVLLFAFFPAALFMLAVYTEAIFCLLSFGAFYFARRRQWLYANICLALCTATRSPGLIVALAVFLEYLTTINFRIHKVNKSILTFALAPCGIVAYALYLWHSVGDPLAMFHAQKYWSQSFDWDIPLAILRQLHDVYLNFRTPGYNSFGTAWGSEWSNLLALGTWLFAIILTIRAWFVKMPLSYIAYLVLTLLFIISKGNFISVNRYILPLFPLYLVLAKDTAKKELAYSLTLVAFCMVMTFGLVELSNSFWTG